MRKKILATTVLGVIGSVAIALPAQAVQRNCNSTSARMCVYYNSSGYGLGAEYGTDYTTPSFNPNVTSNDIYFKAGPHGSAGAGSWVWNGAASMRNFHPDVRVAMYQKSNFEGLRDLVGTDDFMNLVNTKNDNASLGWGY